MPGDPAGGGVTFFSCGPTVYDDAVTCSNPDCGYRGPPRKKARGSLLDFVLTLVAALWAFLFLHVVVGVVFLGVAAAYFATHMGFQVTCPRCGTAVRT